MPPATSCSGRFSRSGLAAVERSPTALMHKKLVEQTDCELKFQASRFDKRQMSPSNLRRSAVGSGRRSPAMQAVRTILVRQAAPSMIACAVLLAWTVPVGAQGFGLGARMAWVN